MLRRVSVVLEIINIIVLLHCFYGKQIKSKVLSFMLIGLDLVIFELINEYGMESPIVIILYLLILIYSTIEFEQNIKKLILSNILYIEVMGVLQLGVGTIVILFPIEKYSENSVILFINICVLVTTILIRKIIHKFFVLVEKNNKILVTAILIFFIYMASDIIQYKKSMSFSLTDIISITVFGGIISIIAYYWQSERELLCEKEIQLEMQELYGNSFKELIETIREKQHDFYNHMQAIQSQHYTIHTYEELVQAQQAYCNMLVEDNKYYKMLNIDNPVIIGFLYGKFIEAEREKNKIDYSISITKTANVLPEYILIEIIGILWDNAVDYLKGMQEKNVHIILEYHNKYLRLEISNRINDISYSEIAQFFDKGYSKKPNHFGIGLHKVKKYSEKYNLMLAVEKEQIDNQYWLKIGLCTK